MIIIDLIKNSFNAIAAVINVAAFLLAVCGALVLHEVAHGYAALWNGDDTAKLYGRLSLKPWVHFNLYGALMFLLLGFGFANPVPINPANFNNQIKGKVSVAIAGIVFNLILAFVFQPINLLLGNVLYSATELNFLTYLLFFLYNFSYLFVLLNINFALFNLLPLYPLDGYRLVTIKNSDTAFAIFLRRYSMIIMLILIALQYVTEYSPLSLYIGYGKTGIMWLFNKFWGLFGLV